MTEHNSRSGAPGLERTAWEAPASNANTAEAGAAEQVAQQIAVT